MGAYAAENCHPAILQFAVSKGLPLSRSTVLGAIKGRSLECLKIAVTAAPENVPGFALVFAVVYGFLDGVRYLHRRGFRLWGDGFPIDAEGLRLMRETLRCGAFSERLMPQNGGLQADPGPGNAPAQADPGPGNAPAQADPGPGNAPAQAGGPGAPAVLAPAAGAAGTGDVTICVLWPYGFPADSVVWFPEDYDDLPGSVAVAEIARAAALVAMGLHEADSLGSPHICSWEMVAAYSRLVQLPGVPALLTPVVRTPTCLG